MKKYTKDHEWITLTEQNIALVGITDFASTELGDIIFVDIEKQLNTVVEQNESFGIVEAVKTVSDLFIPVTAEIIEINQDVINNPSLLNEDSNKNWIIKVKVKDVGQLDSLLSEKEYNELIGR